ncbi:MAG TPA: ABC transporter permease, partial [Cellulomonas sp.]
MLRLTLAQMRRSIPRLVAAGLAIAIGTAFVAATLLAGDVMHRTGRDAVTAQYGQADVVVSAGVTGAALDAVRALPGVAAADLLVPVGIELRSGRQDRFQMMVPAVSDERLTALRIATGRAPAASGEIALPQRAADAFHAAVGDTLTAVWQEQGTGDAWVEKTQTVTLVGIADDPHGAWTSSGGAGMVLGADAARWNRVASLSDVGDVDLLAAAAPGTSATALRDEVAAAMPSATVLTRDDAAANQMKKLGDGGDQALVTVVLGFAAIAMLVAALVIANTFQVLVAQRTRTLALLRAVGARRSQLRASVLIEATLLGLTASVAGIVGGTALAQAMLSVLRRTSIDAPLPAAVHVTWQVVVVPLL